MPDVRWFRRGPFRGRGRGGSPRWHALKNRNGYTLEAMCGYFISDLGDLQNRADVPKGECCSKCIDLVTRALT